MGKMQMLFKLSGTIVCQTEAAASYTETDM